jgi:Kdo2-lipid IVA lauroyltransferase/acyltransferase
MPTMTFPLRMLTWLGLLPVRGLGRLPPGLARALVRPLGPLMRLTMRRRREIARKNLALCFSEASQVERERLLRAHFRQLAEMFADTAIAWQRPGRLDARLGVVTGLANLEAAMATGQGVLLITGHTTCLELGARLFGEQVAAHGIYRPLRNPVLNDFQNRGRARYAQRMIPRDDLRSMVRHLRGGGVLWYAPDQDFGPERSLFAPFFGHPTATARGLLELARLGRAQVVPMYPIKDEASGRVTVHLEPALAAFPGPDPERDLARFNAFLERRIRQAPSQYWWLHRRFKTSPPGQPDRYA